jgi:S1-C subfamily serine protease
MNESIIPPDREGTWRARFQRLRAFVRGGLPFVSGVLAALVALWLYNALTPQPPALTKREVSDSIAQAMASATPAPAFSSHVYRVIRPSLVLIETKLTNGEGEEGRGLGSGVIIDNRGDILTSLHVVSDASEIKVTFADGTESNAFIILSQPENDIAVLQADRPPELLVPAVLGNPNAMRVGDEAYVVGNPFGLYGSMSAGVISGFERTIKLPNSEQHVHGLIQIDAAVNSGNSGGPLMNRYGQVVGIITALANPTDDEVFIGIGFAVPIDVAGGAVGLPPY